MKLPLPQGVSQCLRVVIGGLWFLNNPLAPEDSRGEVSKGKR
jgi:hypothetical protein